MRAPGGCFWGLAFALTIVTGLAAGGVLIYLARRDVSPSGDSAAEYERVRHLLESGGLVVSGSATSESHTEWLGMQSSTFQRWKLDLTLENRTRIPLALGNDLYLVESSVDGSLVDGVLHRVGHPAGEPVLVSSFGLSNFDADLTDGRHLKRQGNQLTVQMAAEGSKVEPKPTSFGHLGASASTRFTPTLAEGVWLKPDTLASVRVVLPEVRTEPTRGGLRFRPVLYLTRPSAAASTWAVSRLEVVALERGALAALVSKAESNLVSRVFAANWLSDIDPAGAGPILSDAVRSLRQGLFLACVLDLLARLEAPGLEAHALALLDDSDLPNGIRRLAARYLGAVKARTALATLERVASEEDDVVAGGAIDALGDLGGDDARAALERLERSARGSERRRLVREALDRPAGSSSSRAEPLSTPPEPI